MRIFFKNVASPVFAVAAASFVMMLSADSTFAQTHTLLDNTDGLTARGAGNGYFFDTTDRYGLGFTAGTANSATTPGSSISSLTILTFTDGTTPVPTTFTFDLFRADSNNLPTGNALVSDTVVKSVKGGYPPEFVTFQLPNLSNYSLTPGNSYVLSFAVSNYVLLEDVRNQTLPTQQADGWNALNWSYSSNSGSSWSADNPSSPWRKPAIQVVGNGISVAVVPESGSLMLFALASVPAVGLVVRRRLQNA